MDFPAADMENTQQFYQYVGGQFIPLSPQETVAQLEFIKRCEQNAVDVAWASLRRTRNTLLTQSDWVVTRCAEQAVAVPASVVAYREALRTITVGLQDPTDVIWPEVPEIIKKSIILDPPPPQYPDLPVTKELIAEDIPEESESV